MVSGFLKMSSYHRHNRSDVAGACRPCASVYAWRQVVCCLSKDLDTVGVVSLVRTSKGVSRIRPNVPVSGQVGRLSKGFHVGSAK